MKFGNYVRNRRKELNIKQITVANNIKRSVQYLNDIEHGRRNGSDDVTVKLALLLNIDIDYLFYLKGQLVLNINLSEKEFTQCYDAFLKELNRIGDK